jgi:hypothetical protein
MGEQKSTSGFGCAHAIAIGCLGILLLVVVVGVVAYYKMGDWVRSGGAAIVNLVAEEALKDLDIPAAEREAAMEEVRAFSQKVKDGEVSVQEITSVAEHFAKGPAFAAIMARGFEVKYLAVSELPEEEKAEGRKTLSRFSHGVSQKQIPRETLEELKQIIAHEKQNEDDPVKFKKALTPEELRRALNVMKAAADDAGVEDAVFTIDLTAEIRKSIDEGMASAAESGGQSGTEY